MKYTESEILRRAGFSLENGVLSDEIGGSGPDAPGAFPGTLSLTPDEIRESDGLPQAISRKCAAVIRETFQDLDIYAFPPDTLQKWEYILPHFRPHMDEYLSSLFLRSCLPDEMRRLKLGETFLTSRDNDPDAKALWPRAATLGIGATVNGGAVPLLLFDEHESYGEERENSSLVILMKRYLLGKQQPPFPFYQMLNEVNYIDMYGGGHSKNLANYVKHLNAFPAENFGGDASAPTWKAAIVDACLTAFYLGLREPSPDFRNRAKWEPFLRRSFADYLKRSPMKEEPQFAVAAKKIKRYLTTSFLRAQSNGELKLTTTDKDGNRVVKGRETGHETDLNLLVPYLPYLCWRYWGGVLGQFVLCFLWESRVYQEMSFARAFDALCNAIPKDCPDTDADGLQTPVGPVRIASCELKNPDGVPLRVFDLTSKGGIAPGPLNRFMRTRNAGFGMTIFRDPAVRSTVLTKGEGVDMGLWERICAALVELEGASDAEETPGAWHVTRHPNGIAGFLLNGNAAHRYAPQTSITAQSLARIADQCAAQSSERIADQSAEAS